MANRSIHNALSDTAVKSAKPAEKAYTMPDGNGLQLLIKPNGSKVWEVPTMLQQDSSYIFP